QLPDLVQAGFIDVYGGHPSVLGQQDQDQLPADPVAATGHDDGLVLDLHELPLPPRFRACSDVGGHSKPTDGEERRATGKPSDARRHRLLLPILTMTVPVVEKRRGGPHGRLARCSASRARWVMVERKKREAMAGATTRYRMASTGTRSGPGLGSRTAARWWIWRS